MASHLDELRMTMSTKETTIELDRRDIELLQKGGSIRYDLERGSAVVWLSMKSDGGPRFNQPKNAKNANPR